MFFSSKPFVLGISDTSLKATSLKKTGSRYKAAFFVEKKLPSGAFFNGSIKDQNLFFENLRDFYRENYPHFKNKKVILSLSEQDTVFTSLPKSKKNFSNQEIVQDLKEPLPFDPLKARYIVKKTPSEGLQIVASEAKKFDDIKESLEKADFSLQSVYPAPLALQELVGVQREPFLLINSEENILAFCLVIENIILFTSTLYLKKSIDASKDEISKTIDEIVKSKYNKEYSEAVQLRNVYIVGKDTDILKSFCSQLNLNVVVIGFLESIDYKYRADLENASGILAVAASKYAKIGFSALEKTSASSPSSSKSKKNFMPQMKIALLVLILLGVGFLGFWTTKYFLPKSSNVSTKKASTSTGSASTKSAVTKQPVVNTATPPAVVEEKPLISRADYRVKILNGSGVKNAAGAAEVFVSGKGYVVVGTGNADSYSYEKTQIQIKESKASIGETLTKDLSERYDLITGSTLSESEPFDILIIVGKK